MAGDGFSAHGWASISREGATACMEVKLRLDHGDEWPLRQAARNLIVFIPRCGHCTALTALTARAVRVGFPGRSHTTEK